MITIISHVVFSVLPFYPVAQYFLQSKVISFRGKWTIAAGLIFSALFSSWATFFIFVLRISFVKSLAELRRAYWTKQQDCTRHSWHYSHSLRRAYWTKQQDCQDCTRHSWHFSHSLRRAVLDVKRLCGKTCFSYREWFMAWDRTWNSYFYSYNDGTATGQPWLHLSISINQGNCRFSRPYKSNKWESPPAISSTSRVLFSAHPLFYGFHFVIRPC